MISLVQMAENAMNLYFQDDAQRQEFFDVEDFKVHIANAYSELLDEFFQLERKEQRVAIGFANVEIPLAWTINETIPVKKDEITGEWYAETSQDMFTFKWDNFGYGIVRLLPGKPEKKDCDSEVFFNGKFVKITSTESDYLETLPITNKCFYFVGGKNRFVFPEKNPGFIIPYYVPVVTGVDDNEVMSDTMAAECIKRVWTLMTTAKNGVVIDQTNDGNENAPLPTQLNPKVNKIQQNK